MTLNQDVLDNIVLYGDPHGDFSEINKIIKKRKPIAIFLLGDVSNNGVTSIPLVNSSNTKIYAISGNHDTGDHIEGVDFVDWSVVTVEGIRFLCLGDAASTRDMESLMINQANVDVVLCHYPVMSHHSDRGRFIKQIFTNSTAAIYFHGHYHSCITTELDGCYSGIQSRFIGDIGMIPSVNTTKSAITLSLNRLKKSKVHLSSFRDLVIATECENMEGQRLFAAFRNNWDKSGEAEFVSKCLDTIKSRVTSRLSKLSLMDGVLKGRPIKAIKLMHQRDWLLIGEDDQISNVSVPTNFLGGIVKHKMLSCDKWERPASKSRFNSVYLIKINEDLIQKIMDKINKRILETNS